MREEKNDTMSQQHTMLCIEKQRKMSTVKDPHYVLHGTLYLQSTEERVDILTSSKGKVCRICLATSTAITSSTKTFCCKHNTKTNNFISECKDENCNKDPTICIALEN